MMELREKYDRAVGILGREYAGSDEEAGAFVDWLQGFASSHEQFGAPLTPGRRVVDRWQTTWHADADAVYLRNKAGNCFIIPWSAVGDAPMVNRADEERETVTLYESNAGQLFIVVSGARLAYDVTEAAAPEGFELDALDLLDGRTCDWTVTRVPAEDLAATPVVAKYVGSTGEVRLTRHEHSGLLLAGHAARTYIGALHYGTRHYAEQSEADKE